MEQKDFTARALKLREEWIANHPEATPKEMGDYYAHGYEKEGFYIDPEKAKYYYDLAGEDFEFQFEESACDDLTGEWPMLYLNGSLEVLHEVKTFFKQINGTPDIDEDIFSTHLLLSKVMQALVGSPYYNGYIYRMDLFDDVIFLLLKTEDHMALCHALNQCFPGLKAEYMDPDWD